MNDGKLEEMAINLCKNKNPDVLISIMHKCDSSLISILLDLKLRRSTLSLIEDTKEGKRNIIYTGPELNNNISSESLYDFYELQINEKILFLTQLNLSENDLDRCTNELKYLKNKIYYICTHEQHLSVEEMKDKIVIEVTNYLFNCINDPLIFRLMLNMLMSSFQDCEIHNLIREIILTNKEFAEYQLFVDKICSLLTLEHKSKLLNLLSSELIGFIEIIALIKEILNELQI